MSQELDSLFSPEKLNKRWTRQGEPDRNEEAGWKEALEATPVLEALSRISTRIMTVCGTEKQRKVMGVMLSEIRSDLAGMDARDSEDPPGADEVFALIGKIQQMEDLLTAYMESAKVL